MNWFEQVSQFIDDNFDDFLSHFFPQSSQFRYNRGVRLNPSPCCQHNDCMSFSSEKPIANCFSCGMKGTRIQFVEQIWGTEEGRDELARWSATPFTRKYESEEVKAEREKDSRIQELYTAAVSFYHMQLFSQDPEADRALAKQTGKDLANGERAHDEATLQEFKVGLALENYDVFEKLMANRGYTEEELVKARKMVWVPPFYYVYPYFDAAGNLIRINTKPYKRTCLGRKMPNGKFDYKCSFETHDTSKKVKRKHEEESGHTMSMDVYSTGEKEEAFYKSPEIKRKKKFGIVVEGENDVFSVHEALKELGTDFERDFLVFGIGGNGKEGTFSSNYLRGFEALYAAFDNDKAGQKYLDQLNEELPEIKLYKINIDSDFNDIDEHLKAPANEKLTLDELLSQAEYVENKNVSFERENGLRHIWNVKNRSFHIAFEIEQYNQKASQMEGTLFVYMHGELQQKKTGKLDTIRLEGQLGAAKLLLSTHLDKYYNEVPWEQGKPKREFRELIDILAHTKNYMQVVKQIAWYLYKAEELGYERLFRILRGKVSDQKKIAEILKEVNGYANTDIDPYALFPKINLSQFFHVMNDDGYFYFSRVIKDGDVPKLVPCLISNRKEEMRLDLLKRKDPQCLLLIQNKYEMPFEVETAVMDPVDVSLQPYWVDKWKNGELSDEDLDPGKLIKEIEDFVRKCYYLRESSLKVLSLWIFSTYFYMLFKSGFPYLMFTGPKGTGKSTLDIMVYLLSINAKIALDMSESALYRTITFEGGTFILDEVENLTDKKVVDSNGYAKILKGGYSESAYVYRTNMDKGNSTEKFSVFGPKVISNINGIEDVIADRCIYIRTFRVSEDKLRGLEDPQIYKEERRPEVHSITSRCALSALTHFKKVSEMLHEPEASFETGNARLTQILKPLITMARFVGGDYEEHLIEFYETEVRQTKDDISSGTVEGMIRSILKRVARELAGAENEKWATTHDKHIYNVPIGHASTLKTFDIDNLHIKVLCEELNTDVPVDLGTVNRTLKALMGPDYDMEKRRRQTTATITDENLQKQLNGKRNIRVYRYTMDIENFLSKDEIKSYRGSSEAPTLF